MSEPVGGFNEPSKPESRNLDSLRPEERDELLGSMLESTQHSIEDEGAFPKLVEFVRNQRLPSQFSFDNLSELVRFILGRTRLKELPLDSEECVSWIANFLYDDPISNARIEKLWAAIVHQIQTKQ